MASPFLASLTRQTIIALTPPAPPGLIPERRGHWGVESPLLYCCLLALHPQCPSLPPMEHFPLSPGSPPSHLALSVLQLATQLSCFVVCSESSLLGPSLGTLGRAWCTTWCSTTGVFTSMPGLCRPDIFTGAISHVLVPSLEGACPVSVIPYSRLSCSRYPLPYH